MIKAWRHSTLQSLSTARCMWSSPNFYVQFSFELEVSNTDNGPPRPVTSERVNLAAYLTIEVVKCHLKFFASVKNNQINETRIVIKLF